MYVHITAKSHIISIQMQFEGLYGRLHFQLQDIEYMIKFTLRNLLIGIDHANTLKS